MRPLFAIAPLAGLLMMIGPQPREAEEMVAGLKARLLGERTSDARDDMPPAREGGRRLATSLSLGERAATVSTRAAIDR
jgi:hypothetical protein